jgi:hypothetical protein
MAKPNVLVNQLKMKSMEADCIRSDFLIAAGLSEAEIRITDDLVGPLDELKASNLSAGPFNIAITENPMDHLTFAGLQTPTVRLLSIRGIFKLYPPQRSGLAR